MGSSRRTCLYNGYWSGEEPECRKSKQDELSLMSEPYISILLPFEKVAVMIWHIQTMAESGSIKTVWMPRQHTAVIMAISWWDLVGECAYTMDTGRTRRQSASVRNVTYSV